MAKLFRDIDGKDKYLVLDRRGKKPVGECFVLKATDPAAPAALEAYINAARDLGMADDYLESLEAMRLRFIGHVNTRGMGDPDAGPDQNQLARPDHADIMDALGQPEETTFKVVKVA